MSSFAAVLGFILPASYFVTIWVYAKAFFSASYPGMRLRRPLLGLTLALHAALILSRMAAYGRFPIHSLFEILSLIALTIALVYLYIELATGNRETGYFILMLPFFFQLLSTIFIRDLEEVPALLTSGLLGFHVSSALFGYAAITISATYGLLYLMLYHDIKSNQFGVVYKRLPNLETLESMSVTATVFGFYLLTAAIMIGLVWLPMAFDSFSYADPKVFGTAAIWLLYGTGLAVRRSARWKGRRMMMLTLVGFSVTVLSIAVTSILPFGFHKFLQ